jgi:hypothetical protein
LDVYFRPAARRATLELGPARYRNDVDVDLVPNSTAAVHGRAIRVGELDAGAA